jgi:hypothetical protein
MCVKKLYVCDAACTISVFVFVHITYTSLRAHIHIHIYTHTYIHTYMHTYVRTYIHTYIRMYIHMCVCVYICMYISYTGKDILWLSRVHNLGSAHHSPPKEAVCLCVSVCARECECE